MTGSTAERSFAEVITATVTRVRRKTDSITSLWFMFGTITPSLTV